jgi:hypothetical protein
MEDHMHLTNSSSWLSELLRERLGPCVSIYMPYARKPSGGQNRQMFKSLVDKAEELMSPRYEKKEVRAVCEKLEGMERDELFRNGPRDGLAVFASPDYVQVVELLRTVEPMVEVGVSFHVKPLVRVMQQGARFGVLCLSLNQVRVFEGNPYQLREVALSDVPRNINETLKGLGADARVEAYGPQVMRKGQPPTDKDNMGVEPFLRAVDHAIWERYSRKAKTPLVVCADEKHLTEFLSLTKNDFVLKEGIAHSPDHLPNDRLLAEAWKIVEPGYRKELELLKEQFRTAKAHHHGSDELMEVAEAVAAGRVGTLLIDERAKIPGVLHRATGFIEGPSKLDPKAEDVLDDLAEMVLARDGEVYVIAHEQMPTDAGLAAMYRY